jgi:hypothetical protein
LEERKRQKKQGKYNSVEGKKEVRQRSALHLHGVVVLDGGDDRRQELEEQEQVPEGKELRGQQDTYDIWREQRA